MSEIEKLYIRGIRSFSPDKPSSIRFGHPLTLIVGANGSGKTTIVECLKYCTTGIMPPNTRSGSFIFDPKFANEYEVRAQVKVLFKNANRRNLICTRSILATQKKGAISQKVLESLLLVEDPDTGKTYSLSSKCAELDLEIPLQLGVSRAILDNVIFCHQEESLWPISESSVLKRRFDEIFASTRYTKVLETIKAIRKEKQIQLSLLSQSLEHLRNNKAAAERVLSSKALQENKLKELQTEIQTIDSHTLSVLAEKIEHMQSLVDNAISLGERLSKQKSEMEMLKTVAKRIPETMYSTDKIEEAILEKRRDLERLQQEHAELSERRVDYCRDIASLRASHSLMLVEQGRLKSQISSYNLAKERIKRRIEEICENTFDSEISFADTIKDLIHNVLSELETLNAQLYNLKKETVAKQQLIYPEIRLEQARMLTIDEKISVLEKEREMKLSAIQRVRSGLRDGADLHRYFENLLVKVEEKNAELSRLKENYTSSSLNETMELTNADIKDSEDMLLDIQNQLALSIKCSAVLDLEKRYNEVRLKIEEKNSKINKLIEDNGLDPAEDYIICNDKVNKLEQDIEELIGIKTSYEAQISISNDKAATVDKILEDLKKRIPSTFSIESIESDTKMLEDKYMEHLKRMLELSGARKVYTELLDNFKLKNICPICETLCSNSTCPEKTMISACEKLEREMHAVELEVNRHEQELAELKDIEVTCRGVNIVFRGACHEDSMNMAGNLKEINETINRKKVERDALKTKSLHCQEIYNLKKEIYDSEERANELNRELGSLRTSFNISQGLRSIEELLKEQEEVKRRLSALKDALSSCSRNKEDMLEAIRAKECSVNTASEELSQIRSKLSEVESLDTEVKGVDAKIEELKVEAHSLVPKINEKEAEISEYMSDSIKQQDAINNRISKLERYSQELKDFLELELEYSRENTENVLKLCDIEIMKAQDEIDSLNASQNQINHDIESAIRSISDLNEEIKNMDDMKDSIIIRDKIRALSKGIAVDERKFDEFNLDALVKTLEDLKRDNKCISEKRAMLAGELKEVSDSIMRAENEYKNNYSNIDEQYSSQIIHHKLEDAITKDLEKYYKALDAAITKYHSYKMLEINMAIHELWVYTYRNSDIDTIEIRSEVKSTKGLNSYNYSVVMIKNGIALDVRGRCSAGQKVLASVIIRLALAETFCSSCGIFALDEPTTNIDKDNIEGLAMCLLRLIEKKKGQKNFQFVIITHDEQFTQYFQQSGHSDGIWRVSKDMDGHSYVKYYEDE